MSDDLPAFGRPMIASATGRSLSGDPASPSAVSAGSRRSMISSNVEIPRPWAALIGRVSSKPSRAKSASSGSCFGSSILLTTRTTGRCDLRNIRARSSSIGASPCCASTTNRIRSLSRIAASAARRTSDASSFSPAPPIPPCPRQEMAALRACSVRPGGRG